MKYVLFLLLPTYLIRFPLFSIPFTLLEVIILCTFGYWILFAHKKLSHYLLSPTILFLLAGTLAVLVAPDTRVALGLWKAYILEPVMVYYLAIHLLTVKDLPKLCISFAVLVYFIAGYLLLQQVGILSSPDPWVSEIPARYSAFYPYPNAVGLLAAPLLVVFVFLGWFFPALLALFSLLSSQSHGALLAVTGTGLLYFLFQKKYTTAGLFTLLTLLFFLFLSLFQAFPTWGDNASAVRVALWEGSARMVISHPWLGVGLGGFSAHYPLYKEASHTEIPLHAHQFILDVWLQLGFLGILAFFWLLWRFYRQISPTNLAWGMMTCLLLYGLVDVPYFKNDLAILFWLILAIPEIQKRVINT